MGGALGGSERWRARTGLSALVSIVVFLVPVLVAIAAATELARIVPMPRSGPGVFGWWVLLLAVPGLVYTLTNRLGRRALPLAALLKMTLVFPDKAPSRMAVARRAGSTRGLERQLAVARDSGIQDEPSVAAEQILALAASLNKHDRMTRGHSERVRVVTDLIAEELKLPQADRDRLRWSALLHDIGKLTVDGSILNKPGKPDEVEWGILQGHPLEGARLAAPLAAWLGSWADTIAQHHEKYDGSGYPYGLSADEISLGGRIVAVADCYETMTAVRSYKSAMSAEAARQELAACAGTHFDPAIVRAFLGASVGRLNLLGGPLAWLGELPLINGLPRLGQLASTAGHIVAGAAAVAGISAAAVVGADHAPPHAAPATASLQRSSPVPNAGPANSGQSPAASTPGPLLVPPLVSPPAAPSANDANVSDVLPPSQTQTALPPVVPPPIAPAAGASPPAAPPAVPPTPVIPGLPAPVPPPPSVPPPSPPTAPAVPPTAPTSVNGSAGDGQVALSWAAPASLGGDPITSYAVTPYVGAVAQSASTFNSALTSQTITGLTNGTAYTFTVTATTNGGVSPPSAPSAPVTPVGAPTAPTSVNGVPEDGQVVLAWTAPASLGGDPITSYTVTPFIAFVAQPARTFNSPATAQTITGLTDGTAYAFTVTATTNGGTSPPSAASSPVIPAAAPTAPTSVNGLPGDGQVSLSWTTPASLGGDPITSYTVTPFIGLVAQPASTFNSALTTQTITGLTNGTAYTFTVTATTNGGVSPPSAPSAPVTPAGAPTAPTSVNGVPEDSQVVLSWTAPASLGGDPITSYTVTPFVGLVAQPATTFNSPATAQTITGLTNGTAYTFTVTATTDGGASPPSAPSASITPAAAPTAPTSVNGVLGDGQVSLSWTTPASLGGDPITSYTVTPFIGLVAQPASTFNSALTTQTITGLTNGTAYTFTVTATTNGGTSPPSAPSPSITPAAVPTAPTSVNGVPEDGQVLLSWTAPSSLGGDPITSYTVTPFIGLVAQSASTFNSPLTTQTITGLTNGTAYTFIVTATTNGGTSPPSAPSPSITPARPPSAPSSVNGVAGDGQVVLSWTAPADAGGDPITSYTVTPYIAGVAQPISTFNSPATTQTISGLTDGTAYAFTVSATTNAGPGPASSQSSPITPTPPNPPTGVSASPSCQLVVVGPEITVDWTSSTSPSVTSYIILRGSTAGSLSPIASVPSGTTEYVDTSVSGVSTTYWYAVEAVGAGGDSTSAPLSATTPLLCL